MLELKEYLNLIIGTYYTYNLLIWLNVNLICYMFVRKKQ